MRSPLACFAFVGLAFVGACGARTSTPPPRQPPPHTEPRATTPPPNPSGPTESECDEVFVHAFAIVTAARQPAPSEADLTALRTELRPGIVADCRAGTRAYHQCGLAAKSVADLDACKS